MNPLILRDNRHSQRIPVALSVLALVEDRHFSMCSENISLDGLFLFSREFVRPGAVFPARVWTDSAAEPLQTYLTSIFTESRWTGYGIGVHLSGISTPDRTHWESFYRGKAAAGAQETRPLAQSELTPRTQRLLVIEGALNRLTVQELRKQGLEVSYAASVAEGIELLRHDPIDAVISDLYRPSMDGLALCCSVNRERLPTRIILLSSSSFPREFLLGLYAGATQVIAKSCSSETLVARTIEILKQPLPAGHVLPASASSIWNSAVTAGPRLSEEAEAIDVHNIAAARRVDFLASQPC